MLRRRKKRSRYATRERDTEYMLAVKQLPCAARECDFATACGGEVEADHAGPRGLSHKADDTTCIPICTRHHRERTDFSGMFAEWDREMMREFLQACIDETRKMLAAEYAAVLASREAAS